MSRASLSCQLGPRIFIRTSVANELWYTTLPGNGRDYHLFKLGWTTREAHPNKFIMRLTLLWLTIGVGINRAK